MAAFDDCIDKLINRERNISSNDDSDEASRRIEGTAQKMVSDEEDESNSRTLRAACKDDGVDDYSKSRHRPASRREDFERNQPTSTGMVSDESISRDSRCSVSNPQRAEQPVTPANTEWICGCNSGKQNRTLINVG